MTNRLLDALSPVQRDRILSLAKPVVLPLHTTLFAAEEIVTHAYFLTSGITSVVIELEEGKTTEVALIGREGIVGGLQLLGPALSPARSFVQAEACGYRVPFAELRKIFLDSEEVRSRVLELVQSQTLTLSQLAACNKLHDAEPRLARWLLMMQDRVGGETISITQEFLALMLGTQRTTVVIAAGAFQRSGLITYGRGKITILSRENLEGAACHCYKVFRKLYSGLYQD